MTEIKQRAITQNIPYIGVFQTKIDNVFIVRIELNTLTPILLFPPEALYSFYDTIKEYYKNNAPEFIPQNLQSILFEDAPLSYGGKLIDQVDEGGVLFDNGEGVQFFSLNELLIEINFVKGEYLDDLVQEILIYANEYHSQFLLPFLGLAKIFESCCDNIISIRDFGTAFDLGSDYMSDIDNYRGTQQEIFDLVKRIPLESLEKMKSKYIEIHEKFGHTTVVDSVADGWDEFLLYKIKNGF